jgi:hypothetical protein
LKPKSRQHYFEEHFELRRRMTQKEGLWLHLIDLVPIPERDEALSLVGRSLIDTNEVRYIS